MELGNEITLYSTSPYATSNYTSYLPTRVCGLRSISIEVLDNEARINRVEVQYFGEYTWDSLPIRADWDFRNVAEEGDRSVWLDIGSHRHNDRSCIQAVRVNGHTYRDYFDFDYARVQFYGSRVPQRSY